jgi:hypothetical protein
MTPILTIAAVLAMHYPLRRMYRPCLASLSKRCECLLAPVLNSLNIACTFDVQAPATVAMKPPNANAAAPSVSADDIDSVAPI